MGEFNSEDYYIYYSGQGSYRRNGVALIINKSPKHSTWVQPQKWQPDFGSFPREVINITVILVYALTTNATEAKVDQSCEGPEDLLELTP